MKAPLIASLVATATVASAGTARADRDLHVGVQALVIPYSKATLDIEDVPRAFDEVTMDPAVGLAASVDLGLSDTFSVGVVNRYIYPLGVKTGDQDADTLQIDLAARLSARGMVSKKLEMLVHLSAGYSILVLPAADAGEPDAGNPTGAILGIAAATAYSLRPGLALVGEVGYTFGFQSTSIAGFDAAFTTDVMHVGVGTELAF